MFLPFLLKCFISWTLPYNPTKCSIQVPQWLSPYNCSICSVCFLIHLQKALLDTAKKLWLQGTFNLHPRPDSLHWASLFSRFLPLVRCSFQLLLLAHFGAALLALRTSHCHYESTLCPLPLTNPLYLSYLFSSLCLHIPRKSQFYSITKSSA